MPEPIILYDISPRAAPPKPWAPNPWKTRFSLKYKGLSFKTEWIEFPDIKAVAQKLGVKPNIVIQGEDIYTLPIIYDPNTKKAVGDSLEIARYLDATYPNTPKLLPDGTQALHAAICDLWNPLVGRPLYFTNAYSCYTMLSEQSQVYFRETRERWLKTKLEDLSSEESWRALEEGFGKIASWLDQNGEGKNLLFLGDRICFADIQLTSLLVWAKIVFGKESEEWARIASWNGGKWKRISELFEKYENDD